MLLSLHRLCAQLFFNAELANFYKKHQNNALVFIDIAFPDNNEKEFLDSAHRLGSKLLFVYDHVPKERTAGAYCGFLVDSLNRLPSQFDILLGKAKREYVQSKRVKIIFSFEDEEPKDSFHQRHSGLNHVMCNLAKGKLLAFSFSTLLYAEDKQVIWGRMMQNARLIRKFKNEFIIASFARTPSGLRHRKDYQALLMELGFDGKQAKRGLNALGLALEGEK